MHLLKAILQLREMLNDSEVDRARKALRKHVPRLVLTPTMEGSRKLFRVTGNVNLGPEPDGGMLLVARDGIEPPTPAFSGLRSTN